MEIIFAKREEITKASSSVTFSLCFSHASARLQPPATIATCSAIKRNGSSCATPVAAAAAAVSTSAKRSSVGMGSSRQSALLRPSASPYGSSTKVTTPGGSGGARAPPSRLEPPKRSFPGARKGELLAKFNQAGAAAGGGSGSGSSVSGLARATARGDGASGRHSLDVRSAPRLTGNVREGGGASILPRRVSSSAISATAAAAASTPKTTVEPVGESESRGRQEM